jgi:hypothetical protein
MASVVQYTKRVFIQRIRKHVSNGIPTSEFSVSDREIMLYIDEALAPELVGQVYAAAKVEGTLVMPESYLTTYLLSTLQQDAATGYWYSTLPQTPVSLPLGYSITRAYFASTATGVSKDVILIKAKRVGRRMNMPLQNGVRGWVENSRIWLAASNNQPLLGLNLYVQMAKTRTEDMDEVMALPDDAIESIFNKVIMKLSDRYKQPKDVIQDNIGAGNTTQKS